jgi:hypothetical protein
MSFSAFKLVCREDLLLDEIERQRRLCWSVFSVETAGGATPLSHSPALKKQVCIASHRITALLLLLLLLLLRLRQLLEYLSSILARPLVFVGC